MNNYLCLQSERIIQYTADAVPTDERKHQIQGIYANNKIPYNTLNMTLVQVSLFLVSLIIVRTI